MSDCQSERLIEGLTSAINRLAHVMATSHASGGGHAVTRDDLAALEGRIMSTLKEHLAKTKAYFDKQATAIDAVVSSVDGLAQDQKTLTDKIAELQGSPGTVTPEDQLLIDQIDALASRNAEKMEAASVKAKALDEMTPPPTPPAP